MASHMPSCMASHMVTRMVTQMVTHMPGSRPDSRPCPVLHAQGQPVAQGLVVPATLPSACRGLVLLALILCLLQLCACAGRSVPVDPAQADALWQRHVEVSERAPAPFRDDMSLRFGTEGNTRRVTALLWGNGDHTLRLDVRAGVGATLAMVRQEDSHFLLYLPMEQKALFHEGPTSPLLKVGVPLPFDLFRLEALVHGRYNAVFGTRYTEARTDRQGTAFELSEGLGGTLVLSDAGQPVSWKGQEWTMSLGLDDEGHVRRVDLVNSRGEKAIVLVRSSERPGAFTAAQMDLVLPEGTAILALEDYMQR